MSACTLSSVNPQLLRYIATRDRRIAKARPGFPTPLLENFSNLLSRGSVKVGGRSSCGGRVDPSWVEFTSWNEVIRKAVTLGYEIEVTSLKQPNAWATKAGGFWNENEYRYSTGATP